MKYLKFFLFLFGFVALERFADHQTSGFQLVKIASYMPNDARWDLPSLSDKEMEQVRGALSQPFYYLSHGGETYAFVSADGEVVLKLFKEHHMTPFGPFQSFNEKQTAKRDFFYNSCKIAYTKFRERTGLLFLHLNKTESLKQKVILYDRLGIAHQIDLDAIPFALQHHAVGIYDKIKTLVKRGELDEAKRCIDSMLALIKERCAQGIADRDPNIRRNCGFVGSYAIEVDIGSYSKDPAFQKPQEVDKFKRWIDSSFPQLAGYIKSAQERWTVDEMDSVDKSGHEWTRAKK